MKDILTVAQFNKIINVHLQTIGMISVVGEITEKQITRNSGLIMTIKDEKENSILKLTGFAPRIKGLSSVDVGMKIVANGVPQVYGPYGSFSLNIISVVPYGQGSLKAAFEKLKKLLEVKGFFAEERKRALPPFVTKIALITADNSAALSDFLKILKENETGLDIDFYPVSVQGKNSIDEITAALNSIQDSKQTSTQETIQKDQVDCAVLTRGGGSLEDLLAFNSEEVAEAVFACKVPVISAVGHERDTSISDMVADIVASTPSQAAYYLASHNDAFLQSYVDTLGSFEQTIKNQIIGLDFSADLRSISQRLNSELANYKSKLENFTALLDSYDPRKVLKRGYAIVRARGRILKSIKLIKEKDEVNINLTDGSFEASVKTISPVKLGKQDI